MTYVDRKKVITRETYESKFAEGDVVAILGNSYKTNEHSLLWDIAIGVIEDIQFDKRSEEFSYAVNVQYNKLSREHDDEEDIVNTYNYEGLDEDRLMPIDTYLNKLADMAYEYIKSDDL